MITVGVVEVVELFIVKTTLFLERQLLLLVLEELRPFQVKIVFLVQLLLLVVELEV